MKTLGTLAASAILLCTFVLTGQRLFDGATGSSPAAIVGGVAAGAALAALSYVSITITTDFHTAEPPSRIRRAFGKLVAYTLFVLTGVAIGAVLPALFDKYKEPVLLPAVVAPVIGLGALVVGSLLAMRSYECITGEELGADDPPEVDS